MTSLSEQLSQISTANQTVALDRKKRSKVHAISFVYEPKFASTQDYDSIYSDAYDALEELEQVDSRFGKFKSTLFSETSINFDRLVQTKEQNNYLNVQVNTFLNLLSPYWHLNIALKAAEWPLRRFQINVYNSEELLLSTLPYFNQQVFKKILYVISQQNFPNIFQWLFNFKKSGTLPSQNLVVKAFIDLDFNNFYSKYLIDQVSHKNLHSKQLIFYISCAISSIVSLQANDFNKLTQLTPTLLETCGELLKSDNQECKITSYTILSVLASSIPLSKDVIFACIDSILSCSKLLSRQSLACILKLFQTLQSFEIIPVKFLKFLNKIETDEEFQDVIFKDVKRNSKFITSYIRSCIINGKLNDNLFKNILQKFQSISNSNFKLILQNLLELNGSMDSAKYFKWLIKSNKECFLETLHQLNFDINNLEMMLQTTLIDEEIDQQISFEEVEKLVVEDSRENSTEEFNLILKLNVTEVKSFLISNSHNNKEFNKLISIFISAIELKQFSTFNKEIFPTAESAISFLIRVSISTKIPTRARLQAILILRRRFKEILKRNTSLFIVFPILLVLLADKKEIIRNGGFELITTINSNESASAKEFFLGQDIYGINSNKIALLDTKDIKPFYAKFLTSGDLYKLDSDQILQKLNQILLLEKKNNKLYYSIFVSHGLLNNLPNIKLFLLKIVIQGKNVVKGISQPSQLFEEFLRNYSDDRSTWIFNCLESDVDFTEFEKIVFDLISVKERSPFAIELLIKAILSNDENLSQIAVDKAINIFSTLKLEFQMEILNKIIDSNRTNIDPIEVLQSFKLSNDMFIQLLKKSTLTQSTVEGSATVKRRRRSSQSTRAALKDSSVAKIATDHLKKVTIILEVLESGDIEDASFDLLQRLLNVLSDLETLDNDGNLPVAYCQETLASCMLKVVKSLQKSTKKPTDHSTIRADSIIATIRLSSSPQVQNKLLLVVLALASLTPETVLHSVMPIFTFMGAHTIRQDDEFSNHVVEQTILCVVPALASMAQNGEVQEIEFLTTSFVSAFQHIPRHRRVKLFTTLACTLGVQYSVSLILFLCGQQYSALYSKHKMADCRALLEFASSFLKNFESNEQLLALLEFLKLWNLLPLDQLNPESESYKNLFQRSIFGVNILSLTKLELFNLRMNMLIFLDKSITGNNDLSSLPHMRIKIASTLMDGEPSEIDKINDSFSKLVQYILNDMNPVEEEITVNLNKLFGDILDLLPIQQFIESILTVINPESQTPKDLSIKRHLTTLAGKKFDFEPTDDLYAQEAANKLIPTLISNIESQDDVELSQCSLDTLSAIFQKFNSHLDPSLLMNCLSVAIGESGLLFEKSPEILVSSINCITSIISIIGVKMIGFFPKIVPQVFKIFYKCQDEKDSELLQISIMILFSCLIKKLPVFMLSNLKEVTKLVFHASNIPESTRLSILDVVVQHMNLKEVLKALTLIWGDVSELDPIAIGLYLHTMELTIENIDKKTAVSESITFVKFLLFALEYRSQSKFDSNTIHRIELSLFQCGINYVMKLNDKSFRPLFASMSRWAFDGEGSTTGITEIDRLLAFFRFFNKLQESLKSIITSYYSYLLENVEKILLRFSEGELVEINLRRLLLISLTSSFKYDQDEFWSTETRFEVISKSLTDQLVNIEDGIGKYLVKAISSLAQTCSSGNHNKTLNELMMKHLVISCNTREKFWSARTMKLIYQKVGDQWLTMLPQMVPLIAELLEDDDEEVEHEVRSGLVKVIESVMGEPLDRYLN